MLKIKPKAVRILLPFNINQNPVGHVFTKSQYQESGSLVFSPIHGSNIPTTTCVHFPHLHS